MPSSCQLPQLPNCNKEARIQIPISFHLWREIRLLYSMPAMHVKAKESDRLAIESSDLLLLVIMSSKMKVASQLWTDWTDCVMDWIGWMVTLKAICGWDGMDGMDGLSYTL